VSGIKRELLYGSTESLANELSGCDVIINLAGASILRRWTNKNKKLIYDSRIQTTKNLVKSVNYLKSEHRPKKFISASAIGIYKEGAKHDERSNNFDSGFVGRVTQDWEDALNDLPKAVQKNVFRIGLVLGKESKSIRKLLTPFKLGVGGRIGSGKQAFPFIHEKDLVKAFVWTCEDFNESKTFNLVAPQEITNSEFTAVFAKKLNRPALITIPAMAIKLGLGESSSLLLESPIVIPKELLNTGFSYNFSTIDSALSDIMT